MRTIFRLLAAAGAGFVLGGLIALPAAKAADGKIIAALPSCEFFFDGIGSYLADYGRGRIMNSGTAGALWVFCPLVRDNPIAKPTRVEVVVIDNSSPVTGPRDITCAVRTMDRTGNLVVSGASVSTSGTNSAGQVLVLPIPATNYVRGTYVVRCQVPPRGLGDPNSGITSVYYEETAQ